MPLTDEDKVQVAQIVGDLLAKALPPQRAADTVRQQSVHVELQLDADLKELFNAGRGEQAQLAVVCQSMRVLREIRDRLPAPASPAVIPTSG